LEERAFIGLGANLGDRVRAIERAISGIAETPGIELVACASLYETEPVGVVDQPWFLNTVVEIGTTLPPRALLARLKRIEIQLGRRPRARWGPREIDLDLLLYGGHRIHEPGLIVPHPELDRRRFVLVPLAELAPELLLPGSGRTVSQRLRELEDEKGVRLFQERRCRRRQQRRRRRERTTRRLSGRQTRDPEKGRRERRRPL
jgi:2-amino-4-hydroxy-6-hydroxymethyldihydropteridine diphosphokinase